MKNQYGGYVAEGPRYNNNSNNNNSNNNNSNNTWRSGFGVAWGAASARRCVPCFPAAFSRKVDVRMQLYV